MAFKYATVQTVTARRQVIVDTNTAKLEGFELYVQKGDSPASVRVTLGLYNDEEFIVNKQYVFEGSEAEVFLKYASQGGGLFEALETATFQVLVQRGDQPAGTVEAAVAVDPKG